MFAIRASNGYVYSARYKTYREAERMLLTCIGETIVYLRHRSYLLRTDSGSSIVRVPECITYPPNGGSWPYATDHY